MKTILLCILCLGVGAAGGSAITGYIMKNTHRQWMALMVTSNLGLTAMYAEWIKMGETQILLQHLENAIPDSLVTLQETGVLEESSISTTTVFAVKRFYVCTKTDIPESISSILADVVVIPEESCPPEP